MKTLLSIFFIFLASLSIMAQGIEFDHTSNWKELKEKAKSQNKLIFIDAFTTWCGPCKMMSKDIFPDGAVGSYYNSNFVNAKIDMEKGEGLEIAQLYGVRAYPTFLFIDGDGVLQHRGVGYQEAADFVKLGSEAMNTDTRMGSLNAKYAKGERDPEFLYKLAGIKKAAYEADADKVAEEYFNTQKDWSTDRNLEMIYEFAGNFNSALTKYYIEHKDKFEDKYGKAAIARKTDQIIAMASSSLAKTDKPDFDKIKDLLIKIDPKHAD
ncbi:MAG TPA: thioredoxin family protein, partial [Saprospiraceae bacterium]|nr:thioredoxin family protein [Saprospiraceae bacterium]